MGCDGTSVALETARDGSQAYDIAPKWYFDKVAVEHARFNQCSTPSQFAECALMGPNMQANTVAMLPNPDKAMLAKCHLRPPRHFFFASSPCFDRRW